MVFQQRRMYLLEAVVALVLGRARHLLVSVLYSLQLRWASEVLYSVRVLLSRRRCVSFRSRTSERSCGAWMGHERRITLHSPDLSICAHSHPALSDHPLSQVSRQIPFPPRISLIIAFFSPSTVPPLQPSCIHTLVVTSPPPRSAFERLAR